MIFMKSVISLTLLVGLAVASSTDVLEDSNLDASIDLDSKKQSKRGVDDSRQQQPSQNAGSNSPPGYINFPQFYGANYAQLGQLFAAAAAPQIYYVKAPQSNHAGVQYAPANGLKIAYAAAPQPQHSVSYATAPTSAKVAIAPQPIYQPLQLSYSHQPLSYSPAAIAVPYNHQQQIIPFTHTNGYQLAAVPHQQVPISQPYSYVAATPAGKVDSTSNGANTNNGYHQQQTFTFPTYQQHVAAPISIPTTQKFVAFPPYSSAQYKTINTPAQPPATAATHTAGEGATSFATFSQQLNHNHNHHSTPTAVTPVKVLAQPHQYYVTIPPPQSPSATHNSQKYAFQPATAASSTPQTYESPHNINGVIHYGSHLYHPAIAKYAYGQASPSQKLIYSH